MSTWWNDDYNDTDTSADSDDSSSSVTQSVSTSPPPIYKTGVLSSADYSRISKIQSYLYVVLESVALVLMTLSAVAFLQDRHSPTNAYLAALCLTEATYMLMLFSHSVCKLDRDCFKSLSYTRVSIWSLSYIGMSSRRCVYVLNAVVSLKRFVAVAFPLQARSVRFLQRPLIPILALVLVSFLLHLYRPLHYTAVFVDDNQGGSWTQGYSNLYKSNKKMFLAVADVAKYTMIYVPMIVCLISNCLLLAALARHKRDISNINSSHKRDGSRSKAERQMTMMILGSTFLTIFLNSPININEAVSMYSTTYGMMKKDHYLYLVMRKYFSILTQTCDILVVLSYYGLSANFRRHFVGLFKCCSSDDSHSQSQSQRGHAKLTTSALAYTIQTSITQTSQMELASRS